MPESIAHVVMAETHINTTMSGRTLDMSSTLVQNILNALPNQAAINRAMHYPKELFWALFIVSALVFLLEASLHTKREDMDRYFRARRRAALRERYKALWNTKKPWVLSLLIDQWFRNLIPGDGMWTPANAKSLRQKKDTSALRELVRMGIYPLYIQDGGFDTTQEKKFDLSLWGWPSWPLYKRSKKRAVFEFVVPRARGWMVGEEDVIDVEEQQRRKADEQYMQFVFMLCQNKKLRRAARWRVAVSGITWVKEGDMTEPEGPGAAPSLRWMVSRSKNGPDARLPTEVGATSHFESLLPFKPDRVLRKGEGTKYMESVWNWVSYCRLLTSIHVPVVRIEASDYEYIELDKEILLIAQNMGLGREWEERLAEFDLREAYREIDLDFLE